MLRFFRLNDPYRLLALLLILVIISIPLLIYPAEVTIQELKSFLLGEALNSGKSLYIQLVDDTAPFASWSFKWAEALFGRSTNARHIVALVFIFFQASFFGILLINNRAYNENTYLPSLIFGLLCFYSFDMLSLSPELLASTMLLFALNNLFKEIEFKVQRDEIILNLGIYLGIASLFIFSYSIFLIGTLIILLLFTRISFRKAMMVIVGFMLPHAILFSFYFFWDNQGSITQHFYIPNLTFETWRLFSIKATFLLAIVPIIYFLLSLLMVNREAHFTKYQSQLLQVMFLWLLVAIIEIIFTRERTAHSYYTFIPPLAYFISHYLLLIRRKRIAELMLWLFMTGLIGMNWASVKGKIVAINYDSLFATQSIDSPFLRNKKMMVLENEPQLYSNNRMAGYFLNWDLSKSIFEQPEYFENIILIEQSFQQDPPDIIVDKRDLMKRVLERIPKLQSVYKREGIYYYKVSN